MFACHPTPLRTRDKSYTEHHLIPRVQRVFIVQDGPDFGPTLFQCPPCEKLTAIYSVVAGIAVIHRTTCPFYGVTMQHLVRILIKVCCRDEITVIYRGIAVSLAPILPSSFKYIWKTVPRNTTLKCRAAALSSACRRGQVSNSELFKTFQQLLLEWHQASNNTAFHTNQSDKSLKSLICFWLIFRAHTRCSPSPFPYTYILLLVVIGLGKSIIAGTQT